MHDHEQAPSTPSSLRERIRYRFDNLLARGMWAVLLWLGLITLLAVVLSSLLLAISGVTLAGSEGSSWLEDFWQSLLRILDTGTMAGDVGWGRRLLALLVTVFGVLIAGTLIGLIASGVEQRVEEMRRGRSKVIESGHVVILGASSRLAEVIDQLTLANRRKKNEAIVVLTGEEPTELDGNVRAAVPDLRGTRLVVRRGDPTRVADLSIAALSEARAVIVLDEDGDSGDSGAVRSVLAAGADIGGFDRIPIIVDSGDLQTAERLVSACGSGVHPVVADQTVARTTVFALREPGLNQVVAELLDLHGADIHIRNVGDLVGETFGDSVFRFGNARPIGRMRPDGRPEINPSPTTILEADDRLITLADDAGEPQRLPARRSGSLGPSSGLRDDLSTSHREEHVLIVGWNSVGTLLLTELDRFSSPASTCEIVYDARLLDPSDVEIPDLTQLTITTQPVRTPSWPRQLAKTPGITSIVLLGYRDALGPTEADSRTLLSLMMLRRELEPMTADRPRIIVELAQGDSVDIASVSGADDYVVSSAIASRLMAQLAEQPERRAVLLSLYAEEGPSLHLVPASHYGLHGDLSFEDIISAVYATGSLAVGWRQMAATDPELRLNPPMTERVILDDDDLIVVID